MISNEIQYELERKIDLYLCGRLNQDQIDELWVEMIENEDAYNYLKTTVALRQIVKDSSDAVSDSKTNITSVISKERILSQNWKQFAAAAVILISAGVGGNYYLNSSASSSASTNLKPFDQLEMVVYRSSDTSINFSDIRVELQNAIDSALLGNTSEAMISLSSLLEKTNDPLIKAEIYLQIGILEYNSDDFVASAIALQNAANLSSEDILLYERIIWNLAHAQMAMGDNLAAKSTIMKVVALEGAHSRAAQNYLEFMD